jgi:hypothetical protein
MRADNRLIMANYFKTVKIITVLNCGLDVGKHSLFVGILNISG